MAGEGAQEVELPQRRHFQDNDGNREPPTRDVENPCGEEGTEPTHDHRQYRDTRVRV